MLSFRIRRTSIDHVLLVLAFTLMVAGVSEVKAQKKYATIATIGGNAVSTTYSNAQGASEITPPGGSNAMFSVMANGVLSTKTGFLQLQFATAIPLYGTVFIKTNAIVNGTLTAEAHTSNGKATGSNFHQLMGSDGYTYFAVTASEAFDRVRIITTVSGGFLSTITSSLNVFYAIYNNPTNNSDCGIVLGTSTNGSGLLGWSVDDPLEAIDGSISTSSSLIPSALLSSAEQTFYFNGSTKTSDAVKLIISNPPTPLLQLSLFNDVSFIAYNGDVPVLTSNLSSVLNLDLLGLLKTGQPVTLTIAPGVLFDKIKINFKAVLSAFTTLNIHDIQRVPVKPSFIAPQLQDITICSGTSATFIPAPPASGNELRWYTSASGGTPVTGNTYTTGNLTTSTTYYVATAKTDCTAESERVPVTVAVNPLPAPPDVHPAATCSGNTTTLQVTAPLGTLNYKWYSVATGGTILGTQNNFTTPVLTAGTTYYVESIITATGCTSATRTSVVVTVQALPHVPPIIPQTN